MNIIPSATVELNEGRLTKVTAPELSGVYECTRLFRRLDRARKHPIVWIAAPAGSGKTTLVASYLRSRHLSTLWYRLDAHDNDIGSFYYHMGLATKAIAPDVGSLPLFTREYTAGLSAFTTNYFRRLFEHLKRPGVVVFDNHHDIDPEGQIQSVLQQGFGEIPSGLNIVVLSRAGMPRAFARARASGRITTIGWDEMKLTERESGALLKLRYRRSPLDGAAIKSLYRETQGWPAGLVLLGEHFKRNPPRHAGAITITTRTISDYFSVIFADGLPSARVFLLKTAFLPKVTVSVAEDLTGEANAAAILSDLTKRNLFTVRLTEESFEYHPLFRAFLIEQVSATHTDAEIRALKQRSAESLSRHGDIETAVDLLQQAEEWRPAVELIVKHAASLVDQGRIQTLETWLRKLPESQLVADPWLLYWLGTCRLLFSPVEARGYFERAFSLFQEGTNSTPLYLAWSGIIHSFIYECNEFTPMNRWLDLYHSLAQDRSPPTPEVEAEGIFSYVDGLRLTRPDHPDIAVYAQRADALLQNLPTIDQQFRYVTSLTLYYTWLGDRARILRLIDNIRPRTNRRDVRPIASLFWCLVRTINWSGTGDPDRSLTAVIDGLAMADSSGIHHLDLQIIAHGIFGQLAAGNVGAARELLQRVPSVIGRGRCDEVNYRNITSIILLREGDVTKAFEENTRCLELIKSTGFYIGTIGVLISSAYINTHRGEIDLALQANSEVRTLSERMGSALFKSHAAFMEAHIRRINGEEGAALEMLDQALGLMKEMGTVTPPWFSSEDAAALYAMALEAGMHAEYVRSLIAKAKLTPPRSLSPDNWPWQVRLYTLGRFVVFKDETPLAFEGKGQRKPLDLLRALIVLGGRHVSANRIMQLLWPDADEERARITFRTTLHRLRRLLGDKCIVIHGSQLTLNAECCWLDVRAFDRLSEELSVSPPTEAKVRRLFDVYRGSLLDDDDAPYVTAERERLRKKFLQVVTHVGKALENDSDERAALAVYERGIETEPLAEEIYRHLMRRYWRLNRPAEALAVYRRCQTAIRVALDIEPSAETKALVAEIQRFER